MWPLGSILEMSHDSPRLQPDVDCVSQQLTQMRSTELRDIPQVGALGE